MLRLDTNLPVQKGLERLTEILKQIQIKLSLCKKSGMHQPIRLRKDGFTAKNIEFT